MTRFYADADFYDTDRDDWAVGPFPFEYYEPPTRPRILRSAFAPGNVRGPLPANNREALLGGRASLHEPGDSAPPPSVLSPARGPSEGSRHE